MTVSFILRTAMTCTTRVESRGCQLLLALACMLITLYSRLSKLCMDLETIRTCRVKRIQAKSATGGNLRGLGLGGGMRRRNTRSFIHGGQGGRVVFVCSCRFFVSLLWNQTFRLDAEDISEAARFRKESKVAVPYVSSSEEKSKRQLFGTSLFLPSCVVRLFANRREIQLEE